MTKPKRKKLQNLTWVRASACIVAAGLTAGSFAQSAHHPEKVKNEVVALVDLLGSSGCEFQRNGSWYSADEARTHLNRKLSYMMERQPPASAEQFVELAASRSSMSGKAYAVRCSAKDAMPSRDWLLARLAHLRNGTHASPRH